MTLISRRVKDMVPVFIKHGACLCNKARSFASSHDKILVDIDGKTGTCIMRLNAPPVNTLDGDMLEASVKAIKNAESSEEVRGIILTSNFNGKVFSSGLNIMDMYQKSASHMVDYWALVQEWYLSWYGCSKPTVAVINGHAPAGGCVWSLMCDYRVMQTGKKIGLNEVHLGMGVPFFIIALLTSTIGQRQSELALTQGKLFDSEDAYKIGIVDDVDTLENVMAKAQHQLHSFMSIPPKAYYLTKFLLRKNFIEKLVSIRKEDAIHFADGMSQPHVQESLGAYLHALKSRKAR